MNCAAKCYHYMFIVSGGCFSSKSSCPTHRCTSLSTYEWFSCCIGHVKHVTYLLCQMSSSSLKAIDAHCDIVPFCLHILLLTNGLKCASDRRRDALSLSMGALQLQIAFSDQSTHTPICIVWPTGLHGPKP